MKWQINLSTFFNVFVTGNTCPDLNAALEAMPRRLSSMFFTLTDNSEFSSEINNLKNKRNIDGNSFKRTI